jgi:hypothetical protein
MTRRQFDRRFGHPLSRDMRFIRQDSTQTFRDKITERGPAFDGRNFGPLDEAIREIERRSHKYAYMLSNKGSFAQNPFAVNVNICSQFTL